MPWIHRLLGNAFPLMALAGLLLAGWGLIVTPEEIQEGPHILHVGAAPQP